MASTKVIAEFQVKALEKEVSSLKEKVSMYEKAKFGAEQTEQRLLQ